MEFFWAYVNNGSVDFDSDVHAVKNEQVYSFSYSHNEGEFALLNLQIRNPRVGLLAPSRKQWLWASYRLAPAGVVHPFFFGRIVGLPENMQEEILTLVFRAEPDDYDAQKKALAETLKVAPYWDPVWIDPDRRADPDVVLEARPARYHIDPVTHDVTISKIIEGEDGTLSIDIDEQYYQTLQFGYGEPPLKKVNVEAAISWNQVAAGSVDIKQYIVNAFAAQGSENGMLTSFTGQGLEKSWPMPGDRIGGGWSFGLSNLGSPSIPGFKDNTNRFAANSRYFKNTPLRRLATWDIADADSVTVHVQEETGDDEEILDIKFYLWKFALSSFDVAYSTERARTENLTFSLEADVQDVVVNAESEETITISSDFVSELDEDGHAPIGDARRRTYFDTDRGQESLKYLIALASHRLLVRARAVNISMEVPFSKFSLLSCRKSLTVVDERLPGGQATGKIVGIGLALDGSTGKMTTTVTVASTIGKGNALPDPAAGTPTYVEDDVIDPGVQQYVGSGVVAIPAAVSYDAFTADIDDDGYNFFSMLPIQVIAGARAEDQLAITEIPNEDESVTIGSVTYVWKADPSEANEVKIGTTTDECVFFLGAAILALDQLRGISFGADTVPHPDVLARLDEQPDRLILVARVPGVAGNSIAVTHTGTAVTPRHPTLIGGANAPNGLRVLNGETLQRQVLDRSNPDDGFMIFNPEEPGSAFMKLDDVIEKLNQYPTMIKMELKPVTGGPFNTDYDDIVMSKLYIPKLIDLEASS